MRRVRHWQDPVTALVGAWMVVAPWVIDYQGDHPAIVNSVATGAALALLGVLSSLVFRHWQELLAAALALWLFVCPWALGFVNVKLAAFNAEIAGSAVFLLAIWTMLSQDDQQDEWSGTIFR